MGCRLEFFSFGFRAEPKTESMDSKPDIADPSFNFRALDRPDNAETHPLGSETKVGHLLDLLRGDFLKFGLHFFWIDDLVVRNQRFSHPHNLIGRTLEAQFVLADRVFLGLAKFLFAWRLVTKFVQLSMNSP